MPNAAKLQRMAARFAPTEIRVDLTKLSPGDRRVLAKLVEASKIWTALFLRQVWSGNEEMLPSSWATKRPMAARGCTIS